MIEILRSIAGGMMTVAMVDIIRAMTKKAARDREISKIRKSFREAEVRTKHGRSDGDRIVDHMARFGCFKSQLQNTKLAVTYSENLRINQKVELLHMIDKRLDILAIFASSQMSMAVYEIFFDDLRKLR